MIPRWMRGIFNYKLASEMAEVAKTDRRGLLSV
jgi:hypothetical protein